MTVARLAAAAGAVAAGAAAAWLSPGDFGALALPAVLIAAMNGYSKAYSP